MFCDLSGLFMKKISPSVLYVTKKYAKWIEVIPRNL